MHFLKNPNDQASKRKNRFKKNKNKNKKTTVHYNSTEPIIFVGDVPPKCLFN